MKRLLLVTALFATLAATAQDKPKQCARVKINVQCTNQPEPNSLFCKLHELTCGAKTKQGTPCQHSVKVKGTKCWQHAA